MEKLQINDAEKAEFLQNLREGMQRGAATDAVFHADDPKRRRQMRDYILETPEFEKACQDAEVEATEHVFEAMYQAAVSGNVAAAKAWIELRGLGGVKNQPMALPEAPDAVRPPSNAPEPVDGDAFGDLSNVEALDPRRRRGR